MKPATSTQVLRRNDPCPCGSGKRYKHCHGSFTEDPRIERAKALQRAADFAGALAVIDAALVETPGDPALHNCQGLLRTDLRDLAGAEASFRRALAAVPDYPDAHFNLGLALLVQGRYAEGWREYAWRERRAQYTDWGNFHFGIPRWNGEPLAGKRILVHAEQGLGDTIQFARFLEPLSREAAEVDVFCHEPIESLMQRMRGVHRAYGALDERPTHDYHAPLIEVAARFLPTADAPHWFGRYVWPLPDRVEKWSSVLDGLPRPLAGFVWKGSASHANDWARSLTPSLAVDFTRKAPGIRFVNLQFGEPPPSGADWIDLGTRLADWEDTLAVMSLVDVVVGVDTSVVHAAGAMARPVWVLRPFAPEWRWGLGETTPWYPTMRLLAQRGPGDWPGLLADVAGRLQSTFAPNG